MLHRSYHNSSYLKFKSYFLKEATANLNNIKNDEVKSAFKNYISCRLSTKASGGESIINLSESTIGKMFNKISQELNEIDNLRTISDQTQEKYFRQLDEKLQGALETLDSLPDSEFLAFREAAIYNLSQQIEKNELRISTKKEKTRLYNKPNEASVIFQGNQYNKLKFNTIVNKDFIQYLTNQAVNGAQFNSNNVTLFI